MWCTADWKVRTTRENLFRPHNEIYNFWVTCRDFPLFSAPQDVLRWQREDIKRITAEKLREENCWTQHSDEWYQLIELNTCISLCTSFKTRQKEKTVGHCGHAIVSGKCFWLLIEWWCSKSCCQQDNEKENVEDQTKKTHLVSEAPPQPALRAHKLPPRRGLCDPSQLFRSLSGVKFPQRPVSDRLSDHSLELITTNELGTNSNTHTGH